MQAQDYREIPYNFTSADDQLIIRHFFGSEIWDDLEELRSQRATGRSSRLIMRCIGDLFILHRNPFLYQELIDSPRKRLAFFRTMGKDLDLIEETARKLNVDQKRTDKVLRLVRLCRDRAKRLQHETGGAEILRARIIKELGDIVGKHNVSFDPFALIAHVTDATDWRLFLPVAVLWPEQETQVPPLLTAIADLGLHVIPRGGGTGLTGGAVPVHSGCVMINTEKLNHIHGISYRNCTADDGRSVEMPILHLEAGVITQDAMAYAEAQNLVFATDPTSAWASTIGGNIAENAGGKTAVLWGTAIDNLLAWSIAVPGGEMLRVQRVNHPMRKILPDDLVRYEVLGNDGRLLRQIDLRGDEIRKKGLWKDITNKFLGGLPGVQKEGCDGVITSAEFILYRAYPKKLTCCLEFFGADMDEASRVIVEISEQFVNQGKEALMALEHFDEEYIRAINYKFKAARSEPPKAVLLIDMVAHTSGQLQAGKEKLLRLLTPYPNTEIFVASDSDEAARFWRDRKRLGAIAARTNAFKLNEDIVLPLPALAAFTRFVDRRNIEEDIFNKQSIINEINSYLQIAEPLEDPDWLEAKIPKANELCQAALTALADRGEDFVRTEKPLETLLDDLLELFRGYSRISENIRKIAQDMRSRRIVIATHMHAGDGNVHVNIPVFSNNQAMMQRAGQTAEDVMEKAVELGGVVSGEHGIGITKIKFLDQERMDALRCYRQEVDPKGLMNPGKLDGTAVLQQVFTPSFNLLELEARILQHNSLEVLTSRISKCVRCGKCKADCCVFYPGSGLFFHPRNKNLAIGSLIEALLYDMQRFHFPRFRQLKNLEDIADHCTLCGKCLKPCPVDIDTAAVSVLERKILNERGYKHSPLPTRLSLFYLNNRNLVLNKIFRKIVLQLGSGAQRLVSDLICKALPAVPQHLDRGGRLRSLLASPMSLPSPQSLREVLPEYSLNEALVLNPQQPANATVFYFPGCGSERLYGDIAMAAIYLLLKTGVRVVLPPSYLCCGFPALANAKSHMHADLSLRDTIILNQIREMLKYLHFDGILVSCGTCMSSLRELGTEKIFSCDLEDVSRFVLDRASELFQDTEKERYLYHAPCHDSLRGEGLQMAHRLNAELLPMAGCCSEAGTLALSRPDISAAMLKRKRDIFKESGEQADKPVQVLTNCPSCLSGLGRNRAMGCEPVHLAVLLARRLGGSEWQTELRQLVRNAEAVAF